MLNSVSASAVYGIADPLQWHANQQKVSSQIRTNDFEQLNVSSVASSTGPNDDPEIKSNLDKSVPTIAEQYWLDAIAARRNRVDGSLEAVKPEKTNPDQAAAQYRQVNELLNPPSIARDTANKVKAISVYA
ncbi:MAG: hypothetical protein H7836_05345 [Magnetococcus sp. YQC-3]